MEFNMLNVVNILGFAGSLRKWSYNRALLSAALDLLPGNTSLVIFELDGIPPFNQDVESSPPEKVKEFKRKIKRNMLFRRLSQIPDLPVG
jgi:chromate reductase